MPCPAVPEDIPKCLVFLLDLYLAKLPQFAFMKDILYLRPKLVTPLSDEDPWYDNVPVVATRGFLVSSTMLLVGF